MSAARTLNLEPVVLIIIQIYLVVGVADDMFLPAAKESTCIDMGACSRLIMQGSDGVFATMWALDPYRAGPVQHSCCAKHDRLWVVAHS